MPIQPNATYVFDLGYYDYAWWAELDDAGCRIVTRLKTITKLAATERVPVDDDAILSDCVGYLPQRQAKHRRNPMQKPVREVQVRIETGRCCGSSPTTSKRRRARSPISTSAAGPSSCSSDGSSKP